MPLILSYTEQPHNVSKSGNFTLIGMAKNPDPVKVNSQEQFVNETKSASDVVRPLLKKPTTCNLGQNDQRWTQNKE